MHDCGVGGVVEIRMTEQKRKKPMTDDIGSSLGTELLGMDVLAKLPLPKLPDNTRVVASAKTPMMRSEPAQQKKKVCTLGCTKQKRKRHVAAMKLEFSDTLISSRASTETTQ